MEEFEDATGGGDRKPYVGSQTKGWTTIWNERQTLNTQHYTEN